MYNHIKPLYRRGFTAARLSKKSAEGQTFSTACDIFFEAEDIRSLHETSEFFLTVICAQAQDDSNLRAQILNGGCKNPSQTLILNITRENVMATHMMKTVIS